MSQEELADRAGLSVRGLRKIEANQIAAPRPGTVRLLADALGLAGDDRDRFCTAAAQHSPDEAARHTMRGTAARRSATQRPPDRPSPAHRPPTASVPAQLPADVGGFTGRADQLQRLYDLIDNTRQTPATVVITAIAGTAGVGKTALAVHWAHQVRHRFPDGQLHVNLRGFDPAGTAVDPAEAIRRFLDALDVPAARIPTDLDAQAALYRSILVNRRMLILLDNARDAEQVRPLLPGASGCLVLVTSRNRLTPLIAAEGAQPLSVDLLTPDEARDLLAERLGADRVASERRAVDAIIAACARLPLALTIAAARAQLTGFPLATIADELAEARGLLDALDTGDPTTEIRAVFSCSLAALTPAAVRLFRLLGLCPGPDITAPAAASLAGQPLPRVHALLGELMLANLVAEPVPGRYSLHDLLRTYANDLALTTDPDDDRHAATVRLLDHYVHTAHAADRLLHPTRDPIPLPLDPPGPGTGPERLTDHDHALAWLITERPALLAALEYAAAEGFDVQTWQLAWQLETVLNRQGHWHDRTEAWLLALAAADRLDSPTGKAYAHRFLAHSHTRLGRYADAHTHLQHALDLHGETDEQIGKAHTHYNLAMLWTHQNEPLTALDHSTKALELYRAVGNRRGQALGLNAIGWCRCLLGDHAQAIVDCEQALELARELGDRHFEAAVWDSLGYANHHLGRHTVATGCYEHSIELYRESGNRFYEADVLSHLGDTHLAAGDRGAAGDAWRRALDLLTVLDHPDARTVRIKLEDLADRPTTQILPRR